MTGTPPEMPVDPDDGVAPVRHDEQPAADCAEDGQYASFHVHAPLEVAKAAGTPVGPVVVT